MVEQSKNDTQRENPRRPGMFECGGPGGPGRPQGSRNAASLLLDKLAEGDGEATVKQVIEAAKAGDMRAAEIILARIWPVKKGRPVSLQLPLIKTAQDVVAAVGVVADAVGAGEITPDEGQAVSAILEAKRKAIETVDLEARVASLEQNRRR